MFRTAGVHVKGRGDVSLVLHVVTTGPSYGYYCFICMVSYSVQRYTKV